MERTQHMTAGGTTNFCPCCSGTQPGHLGYEPAIKLLPCPFCGGPAEPNSCMDSDLVRCVSNVKPHCPASFGGVSVETWNRRIDLEKQS